jgi:hypothetical protein
MRVDLPSVTARDQDGPSLKTDVRRRKVDSEMSPQKRPHRYVDTILKVTCVKHSVPLK